MKELPTTYAECVQNDATVYRLARSCNSADIVIALVREKMLLMERLMKLEAIAPRKINMEGISYIYHCPDELVPLCDGWHVKEKK